MPVRIQRRRSRGWRMPKGAIYVGRPGLFGNPFNTASEFRRWLRGEKATGGGGLRRLALLARLPELQGKDLACWCGLGQKCHADVLLELANAAPPVKNTP